MVQKSIAVNRERKTGVQYYPCVSLIMPFKPIMNSKGELMTGLKKATAEVKELLLQRCEMSVAGELLKKLHTIIRDLNYHTHKKSIAIFLSPLFEKVYYLNLPLTEQISVENNFNLRNLVKAKAESNCYLLAQLNDTNTRIFLFNNNQLTTVVENTCSNITGCDKEFNQQPANENPAQRKKILDKFLRHADKGLKLLLQSYPYPLFVMGNGATLDHFKSITRNASAVVDYVEGNFGKKDAGELMAIMDYYVSDWKKVKQKKLLKQVEEAKRRGKLATGIKAVWEAAAHKRVNMLLIEKGFEYPAGPQVSENGIFFLRNQKMRDAFYVQDMVDDVIEKVISGGGDVEFVAEGLLKGYENIVLIEQYNPYEVTRDI